MKYYIKDNEIVSNTLYVIIEIKSLLSLSHSLVSIVLHCLNLLHVALHEMVKVFVVFQLPEGVCIASINWHPLLPHLRMSVSSFFNKFWYHSGGNIQNSWSLSSLIHCTLFRLVRYITTNWISYFGLRILNGWRALIFILNLVFTHNLGSRFCGSKI